MTEHQLHEIEERLHAATKMPWQVDASDMCVVVEQRGWRNQRYPHPVASTSYSGLKTGSPQGNAQFIAHARHDVPQLIEEIRRIQRLLGKIQDVLQHAQSRPEGVGNRYGIALGNIQIFVTKAVGDTETGKETPC